MKRPERRLRAGDADPPDAGRGAQKTQDDKLRAGGILGDFVGDLQNRALGDEAVGAACAQSGWNARDRLSERGSDGNAV